MFPFTSATHYRYRFFTHTHLSLPGDGARLYSAALDLEPNFLPPGAACQRGPPAWSELSPAATEPLHGPSSFQAAVFAGRGGRPAHDPRNRTGHQQIDMRGQNGPSPFPAPNNLASMMGSCGYTKIGDHGVFRAATCKVVLTWTKHQQALGSNFTSHKGMRPSGPCA